MPIVPRGAATSLSGQTIGPAIVIDFSKYLNRIGIVDRDAMTVRVEPGVVLDQLNAHLKPLGLMFGPGRLDQRPGHDRRDDRQQLGRRPVAPLRQDRRSRPRRRRRAGRRHDGHPRPGRRRRARRASARAADSVGAVHRVVRDTVAEHAQAIARAVPADPAPGQRLQPRRVRPGLAGPAAWAGATSPGGSTWPG